MKFSFILPVLIFLIPKQAKNLIDESFALGKLDFVEPREFFIEDRLEKYRLSAECNLGESGIRNFSVGQILEKLGLDSDIFQNISLDDSPNQGSLSLRREIADLYGGKISEKNVLVTTGTSEALFLFFHIQVQKGSKISLLLPAFQALYEIPKMLGGDIRGVYVDESYLFGEEFCIDRLFLENPDIAIINHPHNPTGMGLGSADWKWLEENLVNQDTIVLFDEHYRFLDFETDLTRSGAMLSKNCFATGSITKCFGVVGLKIGWIVGEEDFIQRARSFKDYLTHTVNPISEFLAEHLIQNRNSFLIPIRERIRENIKCLEENLSDLKSIVGYRRPMGGLVSFLKLKEGILSEEYADNLYHETSVFVLPGINFEREGFLRIGLGEDSERFRAGIMRWVEWENRK